jgi:hypothetical protein
MCSRAVDGRIARLPGTFCSKPERDAGLDTDGSAEMRLYFAGLATMSHCA